MNDVTRQGLSTCPDTKLPRHFSTLSSTSLVLPRNRLVRNATTRQMTDMLSIVVLGNGKALDHADADVDAWLVEVNLEERSSHNSANTITDYIHRQSAPSVETFLTPLFFVSSAKRRIHHKNRKFPDIYSYIIMVRREYTCVHIVSF